MAAATGEPYAAPLALQNGFRLDGFAAVPELSSKVDQLNQVVADPSAFFQPQASLLEAVRNAAQALFQHTAHAAHQSSSFSLPLTELYVDGFDSEQIWLQLELQTEPVLKRARRLIKSAGSAPVIVSKEVEKKVDELINGPAQDEQDEDEDEDESASEGEDEDGEIDDEEEDDVDVSRKRKRRKQGQKEEDDFDEDEDEDGLGSGEEEEDDDAFVFGKNKKKPKSRATGVEDEFFKLGDMEKFLEASEKAAAGDLDDEGGSDEDEDEDGELDDDDEDGMFGRGRGKKDSAIFDDEDESGGEDDEEMEEGEDGEGAGQQDKKANGKKDLGALLENGSVSAKPDDESVPLSKHERHLKRVQEQIKALEDKALAEKPWQLKGEVTAADRPLNSALEVYMDTETRAAPVPVPTEEQGQEIEDIIKRRIIERRFDDPVRILPPEPPKKKKEFELDDKKSGKGLAELYEEEYVQAVSGVSAPDKLDPVREEAKGLFKLLCGKLDALSHFHYAPKPVVEEMVVRSDVAALAMEEVAPLVVSTEAMQAPVEAHKSEANGVPQAEGEMTREDRKRRRAAKKRASKAHKVQKDADRKARGLPALESGNVVAGVAPLKKAESAGKQKRSDFRSSAVFARIQDLQTGGGAAGKKKGDGEPTKSSANFKL